jgi:hypothetical protein
MLSSGYTLAGEGLLLPGGGEYGLVIAMIGFEANVFNLRLRILFRNMAMQMQLVMRVAIVAMVAPPTAAMDAIITVLSDPSRVLVLVLVVEVPSPKLASEHSSLLNDSNTESHPVRLVAMVFPMATITPADSTS